MIKRATRLALPEEPLPELINALLRGDLYLFSVKAFAHFPSACVEELQVRRPPS